MCAAFLLLISLSRGVFTLTFLRGELLICQLFVLCWLSRSKISRCALRLFYSGVLVLHGSHRFLLQIACRSTCSSHFRRKEMEENVSRCCPNVPSCVTQAMQKQRLDGAPRSVVASVEIPLATEGVSGFQHARSYPYPGEKLESAV